MPGGAEQLDESSCAIGVTREFTGGETRVG
jgi:hypothetical protein